MKQRFKKSAKDFFEQQQLSDDSLNAFEDMLVKETPITAVETVSVKTRTLKYYALAASIALMVAVGLFYLPGANNLSLDIANEVAKNHIKMKPLEVKTQSLSELRQYFTALDFSVTRSDVFGLNLNAMLGARYCSIQGITAAQLRFVNEADSNVTLYQVPYDAEPFGGLPIAEPGDSPKTIYVRGLKISMWVEKGLLMVTAEESL
ncbi:MAG: hypothetical protein COB51_10515 [Moraxellaceae bacterium]|nr:MAG: hypothetical protein COB51_10515 [Moraxellaceae bacterium]